MHNLTFNYDVSDPLAPKAVAETMALATVTFSSIAPSTNSAKGHTDPVYQTAATVIAAYGPTIKRLADQ